MSENILFVDDEPAVLESYQRLLYRDFCVMTAASGQDGLAEIEKRGPYAVVVSDMRMPGMDGVQFLSRVREVAPQTVRVVLTGYADIESAMNAVNEDAIFRFLTKPCPEPTLKKTLNACLLQHRLQTAEKELLENTLMGSIKVLTDVLSLVSPAAFGRSLRIRRYVEHMVRTLKLPMPWKYEAAAMLSQLGCIALEPEILEAACCGESLSPEYQQQFNLHPAVAQDLLGGIPRLEGIAWIIGHQLGAIDTSDSASESMRTGAAILRAALAFDEVKNQGRSDAQAVAELQASAKIDDKILKTLVTLQSSTREMTPANVDISTLKPGMILDQEIRSRAGLLLAGKGQDVSYSLIVRLRNFHRRKLIENKFAVLMASPTEG